jgi:hypothetical protein
MSEYSVMVAVTPGGQVESRKDVVAVLRTE